MSKIERIHTSCKQCVCADYKGKTQVGCLLDYIELYQQNNIEILEAYDEEKEFYIINNKKCVGYRENGWFEKRELENLTLQEKIEHIKNSNFLHYLLIIDLKSINENQIEDLLAQASYGIKPQKIILIRHQNDRKNFAYEKLKSLLEKYLPNILWRIQTVLLDRSHEDIVHEICNLNKKYRFILDIKSYNKDIERIINRGNDIVYKEFSFFPVITNLEKSALLFSGANYRYSMVIEKKNLLKEEDKHIVL